MMRDQNIYVTQTPSGDLEAIDMHTGEVVSSNDALPATAFRFNYERALLICQMIREGKTMEEIAKMPDMPPLAVMFYWSKSDRMFSAALKEARKDRGETFHDRVIEHANAALTAHKDSIPGLQTAIKAYQWAAEKADPDRFGNKVTHEGSETKPIVMRVVDTGIRRAEPKPEIVEVIDVKDNTGTDEDSEDEDYQ